jgi:hypothetical protein
MDLLDPYILQLYQSKTIEEVKGPGVCCMNYAYPSQLIISYSKLF